MQNQVVEISRYRFDVQKKLTKRQQIHLQFPMTHLQLIFHYFNLIHNKGNTFEVRVRYYSKLNVLSLDLAILSEKGYAASFSQYKKSF